jgi:hypothetical protein
MVWMENIKKNKLFKKMTPEIDYEGESCVFLKKNINGNQRAT